MLKLQSWLQVRYEDLWDHFSTDPFRFTNALKIIRGKSGDTKEHVVLTLSKLRKAGLLATESDPEDSRKRIYRLKSRAESIAGTISRLSKEDLAAVARSALDMVWGAGKPTRQSGDYHAILGFIFFKLICDRWTVEFKKAMARGLKEGLKGKGAEDEAAKPAHHEFDIPREFHWETLRSEPARLPQNLSRALKVLSKRNPSFRDVFEETGFAPFAGNPENSETTRQLVELLSPHPMDRVSPDLINRVFDMILWGNPSLRVWEMEAFTPPEIIPLMVRMLQPEPGESVYDPALGYGGTLVTAYQHVLEEKGKAQADKATLFGQEIAPEALALARLHLCLNGIRNFRLALGDTLLSPKFRAGEKMQTFDLVLSHPDWHLKGYGEDVLQKTEFSRERFGYGFTPSYSADWAWIQHLMASAEPEGGRVGVVMDAGCLFRGGKERSIRAGMIEKDLLEAAILLPGRLFFATQARGTILVFRHRKAKERQGKVLFIDASREHELLPGMRGMTRLGPQHQARIVEAYLGFCDIPGLSRVVSCAEIRDQGFNLNIAHYVSPGEKREEIDIPKVRKEIKRLDADLEEASRRLESQLDELRYK